MPLKVLDGVKVLDFTQALAGPAATQRLADWGADVVKVEPERHGEWTRSHPIANAYVGGHATTFLAFNRNKDSIAIDLKSDGGQSRVRELIQVADVVVHNFRPGVAERIGISANDVHTLNPRAVYAFVSGYGDKGPGVARPGQDLLLQAFSGSLFSVGARQDRPQASSIFAADVIASHYLTEGILLALWARQRTGAGDVVHVSMLGAMLETQAQELVTYLNTGIAPERGESPVAHALINPPYGLYEARDGWLAIAMAEPLALGRALDSDFITELATWEAMADHRDEVFAEVSKRIATGDRDAWIRKLDAEGVWAGPVHGYHDLVENEQVVANDYFVPVPLDQSTFLVPDNALRLSLAPQEPHRSPPSLDRDHEAIIDRWLGDAPSLTVPKITLERRS